LSSVRLATEDPATEKGKHTHTHTHTHTKQNKKAHKKKQT